MSTKLALAAGTVALTVGMMPCISHAQVQTQRDITWKLGLAIAQGAIEACAKNNIPITVAVVDRAGRVRVFIAPDNPSPHNFELARRKAYTARTFRIPSGEFAQRVKDNPTTGQVHLTNIIANQGALPIKVGDDVIGAAGVSGAPGGDKDEACVKAGIDKIADQLK